MHSLHLERPWYPEGHSRLGCSWVEVTRAGEGIECAPWAAHPRCKRPARRALLHASCSRCYPPYPMVSLAHSQRPQRCLPGSKGRSCTLSTLRVAPAGVGDLARHTLQIYPIAINSLFRRHECLQNPRACCIAAGVGPGQVGRVGGPLRLQCTWVIGAAIHQRLHARRVLQVQNPRRAARAAPSPCPRPQGTRSP